ncbi:cobalamin-binding protein [Silvimonas sp. JCM 19000]
MRRIWLASALLCSAPTWAVLSVNDDAGRSVAVLAPAQRVVTLSPHATELVAALAPQRVVGVDSASNYPASVSALPKVADFSSINVERILALRPDLVVVWESSAISQPLTLLLRHGIPVFVSKPQTPLDVAGDLRRLGHLLGTDEAASTMAAAIVGRDQALRARYAHARPVRVFLQVNEKPLMSLSRKSFLGQALNACGAVGPYDAAQVEAPLASTEVVLGFAPELLITTGSLDTLQQWQAWPALPAIARKQRLSIAADEFVRPGPRLIDGMEKLCLAIDRLR